MPEMQKQIKPKYFNKTAKRMEEFKRKLMDSGTSLNKPVLKEELEEIKELFYYEKKSAARASERWYKAEKIIEKVENGVFENFISASVLFLGYFGSATTLFGSVLYYFNGDVDNFRNLFKASVLLGVGTTAYLGICKGIEHAAKSIKEKCIDKSLEIYREICRIEDELEDLWKKIKD